MPVENIYDMVPASDQNIYCNIPPREKQHGKHTVNTTVKKASSCKWAAVGFAVLWILSLSVLLGVTFHRNAEYASLFQKYSDLQKHLQNYTDMTVHRNAEYASLFQKYSDLQNHLKKDTNMTENYTAVWKWILGAAVDVTLDPDTAHPKLILSEEGKQVSLGDTLQDLPDNPKRFDPVVIVLGRQGFTSGRHYWQVEVGDKPGWELGVARESITRKGKITLTPKNGYWTMWLRDGEYLALADPSTRLPLSLKPWKVGVYLDYEEGQVSFYNVETRSHIYTFTDTFTEKLYPFFCPSVNTDGKNAAPLIILPVSDRD
ncbi:E3 ubiquitin-protein ligase TRIM39-like [Polyodon spathula]|uniref:E3 ubiquitin-protein ligase TRIM39-like n=1 Tax=Polyodon spathula TaxID=7913 RepID=UPI001B7ED911|nr:E3 ubiquitin-protein ligase TRIM39-like [Polyodon spathula]XP_041092368.1 E3 ubiquitin-protein ligase TRIM39-like [Polyodon spathula]XP_041092369.1 E3 ubiquitin-protein ligase TRIM39-like [Polyodon spathula]